MKSFIPKHVNNKVVVGFLSFARAVGKPFGKRDKSDPNDQLDIIRKHFAGLDKTGGYIEDQNAYKDVVYGGKSIWYAGCGVLASFNALHDLEPEKEKKDSPERLLMLIKDFEKKGIVFSGNLGTAPMPIKKFFESRGYRTEIAYKASEFDRLGEKAKSLILTAYMDENDITKAVHHIYISKRGGKYTPHNVYCNGYISKPQDSVSKVIESINNGRAKGICLIGIM